MFEYLAKMVLFRYTITKEKKVMFDNHCSKCNCNFDIITEIQKSIFLSSFESQILFCPHCGVKI